METKTKKTVTGDILNHLKRYGSINQLKALERYGTWRLADVIFRLREQGYKIRTEDKLVKTRYGKKVNVAVYRLITNR